MDDHARLARAEADFREAVQREQSALMASGVCRTEATEILLRRLRGDNGKPFRAGHPVPDTTPSTRATPPSPSDFPPEEFATLVNVHGYSAEDAARALTICHEIRLLEAAGVGGVAAAEELTRRVVCVDRGSGIEGRAMQAPPTQDSARRGDVGATGAVASRVNGGGAAIGFSSGGQRHSRSSCNSHRTMREDSSSSAFMAPPMPWESLLQERGNRGSRGAQDGAGGIVGGDHISGCTARGSATGADPKGSMPAAITPSSGGVRSPRLGARKRQHTSMLVQQHNCGGGVEQGSFSHTLSSRAPIGGGVNGGVTGVLPWSPSFGGPATPCASRSGAGEGSNGSVVAGLAGAESTAMAAASTSTSLSVHRPSGDGPNGMKVCDGMDISNALVQGPAAKRPRCHVPGGGQGCDVFSSGRADPRQLVFVDQGHRQEDQEQQLQHAFHQLGVRQRNTQPSNPQLMSAVPPKRPRTPNDETPPAPCKRLKNS